MAWPSHVFYTSIEIIAKSLYEIFSTIGLLSNISDEISSGLEKSTIFLTSNSYYVYLVGVFNV